MKWQLAPALLTCALSTCAAAPREGPGIMLGTHHRWMILSDVSSLDRMHIGDIVLTDSRQVLREWKTTQTLWARMQSRVIVLPQGAYADLSARGRRLGCTEIPPEQPGLLAVDLSDGHGHQTTCILVRPASCEFVARIIDAARRSKAPLEPLTRLRRTLTCSP